MVFVDMPGVINYFVQLCNEVNNTIAVKKTIKKKISLLFAVKVDIHESNIRKIFEKYS